MGDVLTYEHIKEAVESWNHLEGRRYIPLFIPKSQLDGLVKWEVITLEQKDSLLKGEIVKGLMVV